MFSKIPGVVKIFPAASTIFATSSSTLSNLVTLFLHIKKYVFAAYSCTSLLMLCVFTTTPGKCFWPCIAMFSPSYRCTLSLLKICNSYAETSCRIYTSFTGRLKRILLHYDLWIKLICGAFQWFDTSNRTKGKRITNMCYNMFSIDYGMCSIYPSFTHTQQN